MTTRLRHVSRILERYPAAHRAARYGYRVAYTAPALVRRPYQIRNYLSRAGDFTGLQIGAGPHQLDGWLATDLVPDLDTVYMDATKRFPFASGTFDYIVAEHIIEHVPYEDALTMLRECHRVLKSGGAVRVSTPNIELTHQLMHPPFTPRLKRYVAWSNSTFGRTDDLTSAIQVANRLHHEFGHQFLYDLDTLIASLRRSGFASFAECVPNKSSHAALRNVDRHAVEIGEEFNELESLIVEATK